MSSASATRTIKFISKGGTYTAVISSPNGDLYQEWEGTQEAVTKIYPNYESTQPILYFVCMSSRVAEGVATPIGIKYYFNGTEITFSGDTSSGIFAGMFKKIAPSGSNLYYGLQILKNLVIPSNFAPAVIRMEATVSYGTQTDQLQATYTIPIQQSTGAGYRITIAAGDNKNFVITEKGTSCILKAMCYQSGEPVNAGLTYKWEKMAATGWQTLTGQTGQTLTVAETDIDTYGEFMVTVYSGSGSNVVELGKDIQGVMDASDPYDIDPRPNPADETISEDPTGNAQVTYTPRVVKRGTTQQVMPNVNFYFVVKDAVGNILNVAESQTAKPSCSVTREQCVQATGDVSITITAAD